MIGATYRTIFRKYRCPNKWQKSQIIPDLRESAFIMLKNASWPTSWGFKISESLFILPELQEAFPKAKYVFLHNESPTTDLGRNYFTTTLDYNTEL